MDELWKTTLAGGKTTTVLMAQNLQDLSQHLGEYGRNVMWVSNPRAEQVGNQVLVIRRPGVERPSLNG